MTHHLTDEPGKVTRITPREPEPMADFPEPRSESMTWSEGRNPLFPESWVFTFGLGHPLARRYVQFTGTEAHGRDLMRQIFGQGNWAGSYRDDVASRVIDKGRLTLLDLGL